MNKKIVSLGFLSAVVAGSVLTTSSVSAFWPFDSLFSKGSVKASTTSTPVLMSRVELLAQSFNTINSACKDLAARTGGKGSLGSTAKDKELASIDASLQKKCVEIKVLSERLRKIYTYPTPMPNATTTPASGKPSPASSKIPGAADIISKYLNGSKTIKNATLTPTATTPPPVD